MKSKILEQIEKFMNNDESYEISSINKQVVVSIKDDDGNETTQAFLFSANGEYIDNYEV